jgi:hypothetical protein
LLVASAAERGGQDVAVVGVPVPPGLLVRLGHRGEVPVDVGKHASAGPVVPVQVCQPCLQPLDRVADQGPGAVYVSQPGAVAAFIAQAATAVTALRWPSAAPAAARPPASRGRGAAQRPPGRGDGGFRPPGRPAALGRNDR